MHKQNPPLNTTKDQISTNNQKIKQIKNNRIFFKLLKLKLYFIFSFFSLTISTSFLSTPLNQFMPFEETLYSSLYTIFYKILHDPIESAKILMEILVLILILQFRVRDQSGILKLPEHVVTKLINEFEPEPLVDPLPPTVLIERIYNFTLLDLCNYDAFDLRNKFKSDLKATVQKYGVGTCGPPTFFGTLDIHKELEQSIANHLNTESALLYSNITLVFKVLFLVFVMEKIMFFIIRVLMKGF